MVFEKNGGGAGVFQGGGGFWGEWGSGGRGVTRSGDGYFGG
jgi:hypothetical protein